MSINKFLNFTLNLSDYCNYIKLKVQMLYLHIYSLIFDSVKCILFNAINNSKDWGRKSIRIYYSLMNNYEVIH